ncbi:HU family DNA-binding protein, partial [Acinetobacter baumannii]|nr:HU family DNA-binding protein [Acinetobacter baumannii]
AQATAALNALESGVTKALAAGEDVALIGFGTFTVKKRAARTGRNPKTGEELQIAASKVPSFKAGKALKEAVNG